MLASAEIRTLITALGAGIATDFDAAKVRYHKIVIMTDADVDGSHIRTLLLTFFFRHMAALIDKGFLYIAQPPLFKVAEGKKETYLKDEKEMSQFLLARIGEDRSLSSEMSGASVVGREARSRCSRRWRSTATHVGEARRSAAFRRGSSARCSTAGCRRRATSPRRRRSRTSAKAVARLRRREGRGRGRRGALRAGRSRSCARVNGVARSVADRRGVRLAATSSSGSGRRAERDRRVPRRARTSSSATARPSRHQTLSDRRRRRSTSRPRRASSINRYKGLGEMNAGAALGDDDEPGERGASSRSTVEDAVEADEIFSILMGDAVEPRREFIEKNALNVRNLDI